MKPSKLLLALTLCATVSAYADTLYKYVDANGKVTYSDRKPKPGEKATVVDADPTINIFNAPAPVRSAAEKSKKPNATDLRTKRVQERAAKLDALIAAVEKAEADLDKAKKALEDGQAPTEDERRIRVGYKIGKDGKPTTETTGVNVVTTTEDYAQRIAKLEAAVTAAEENLEKAREAKRAGGY